MAIVINSFNITTVDPARPAGSPLEYSWDVAGATTITFTSSFTGYSDYTIAAAGIGGIPFSTGDISYCDLTQVVITLTATDGGLSTVTAVDTISAASDTGVLNFGMTPATATTVSPGDPVSMDWQLYNVCLYTLSADTSGVIKTGGPGADLSELSYLHYPTVSQTYTLEAAGSGFAGISSQSVQFYVLQPPTINFFTANPSSIPQAGDPSTLSWGTTNAISVSINQGVGTVSIDGSYSVSPSVDTVYTLLATSSAGLSATALATVSIVQTYVTIFNGENSGTYLIDELNTPEGWLKIIGRFKKTTAPGEIEEFAVHSILNTLTS